MPWARNIPVFAIMSDLLTLRLRVERLALVRKLHAAEAQIQQAGGSPQKIREIRHLIQRMQLQPHQDEFAVQRSPRRLERRVEVKTVGSF